MGGMLGKAVYYTPSVEEAKYFEDKRVGKQKQLELIDLIPKEQVDNPSTNGFYRVSKMDENLRSNAMLVCAIVVQKILIALIFLNLILRNLKMRSKQIIKAKKLLFRRSAFVVINKEGFREYKRKEDLTESDYIIKEFIDRKSVV